MLTIGIFSALGLLLLALKIGGRKTIGHDVVADILITATLMVMFYGTYSGMTAAMVGGLVASITLFLMKKVMVHKKLQVEIYKKKVLGVKLPMLSFSWRTKQPDWLHHNQYWRK
jgi:thiamine transporter ThiT